MGEFYDWTGSSNRNAKWEHSITENIGGGMVVTHTGRAGTLWGAKRRARQARRAYHAMRRNRRG